MQTIPPVLGFPRLFTTSSARMSDSVCNQRICRSHPILRPERQSRLDAPAVMSWGCLFCRFGLRAKLFRQRTAVLKLEIQSPRTQGAQTETGAEAPAHFVPTTISLFQRYALVVASELVTDAKANRLLSNFVVRATRGREKDIQCVFICEPVSVAIFDLC
jgi:hypothetical protein